MDAVKFLKEKRRMCNNHFTCDSCPVMIKLNRSCIQVGVEIYEDLIEIVEEWSRKNPEEMGKKYIIEIDDVSGDLCRIKYINEWLNIDELDLLKEYNESEV